MLKKFFEEFKEFISKGNVMDLAVGVIIGSAFSSIVKSFTDNIIKPLINCIGGADIREKSTWWAKIILITELFCPL